MMFSSQRQFSFYVNGKWMSCDKIFCLNSRPIVELLKGKGPLTSTGIESLLYMKSNISTIPDPSVPDIELLQSFATVAFDTGW